eukprot:m.56556 g.56556  ORF g.56556 m.56556 type:complete len:397 (-) comp11566_c0_seq6:7115-8305(-)
MEGSRKDRDSSHDVNSVATASQPVDLASARLHMMSSSHSIVCASQNQAADVVSYMRTSDLEREEKDKQMKEYLDRHDVHVMLEAIATAAGLEKPKDPRAFLIEKLQALRDESVVITWDLFVRDEDRPPYRPLPYWMRRGDDDDDTPSAEAFELAFVHNSRRVLLPVVRAWKQWFMMRKELKQKLMERLDMALHHYHKTLLKRTIQPWIQFKLEQQTRRRLVIERMRGRRRDNLVRVCFNAWLEYAQQARLASLYFENLTKESAIDASLMAHSSDHFSSLPYPIRLKIFSFLNLKDLLSCARVCRSWHEVTQDPQLWDDIRFNEIAPRFLNQNNIRKIIRITIRITMLKTHKNNNKNKYAENSAARKACHSLTRIVGILVTARRVKIKIILIHSNLL